ncbi:recombination protein NinB [Paraburkholderia fungorum]|uniref:recombination protein NinB n=1 Tax=Paraburkholderia fungorum TaxID=134537 RepID=UPI0038BB09BF
MSEKQTFKLVHATARQLASRAVINAPDGFVCKIEPPPKSRPQEEKYHAMIGDIAKQVKAFGEAQEEEDMKRLLVDQFARDMTALGTPLKRQGRVVPSLDGTGVVQLGVQTRKFLKAEANAFIEWLYAFGAEQDVQWSERAAQGYEELAKEFA